MAGGVFDGINVVVVGGGAGLGRQYCIDLAGHGANVLVVGRGESVFGTTEEIAALGGRAQALVADIREGEMILTEAVERFGHVDSLIVNAGILQDRSYLKMTQQEWNAVISIHLEGTHSCARAFWPHMMERGQGRIVLTISGAAMHGNYGQANYAAAKGGIVGLMKTMAIEGARKNIFTNAIAPTAYTQLTDGLFSEGLIEALPASKVSPFVLAMIHPSSQENGSVIEAGGGWAAKYRWERSGGLRLDDESCTLENVMAGWDDVVRFDDRADHPQSAFDSLKATVGPELASTFAAWQ